MSVTDPRSPKLFCNSWLGANIEFDFTRHLDDALRMVAGLQTGVFQSLGAVDEQAAKGAASFAGNPVAGPIPANKNDPRTGIMRRQPEELNHHLLSVCPLSDLNRKISR